MFQHAAARRRLAARCDWCHCDTGVSTRSRPKAAGTHHSPRQAVRRWFQHAAARRRLETQYMMIAADHKFQHAAARRRLVERTMLNAVLMPVSTRSRPKAAGQVIRLRLAHALFQHAAARRRLAEEPPPEEPPPPVSTRSRPKAAGSALPSPFLSPDVSTRSRPKAAGRTLGICGRD